MNYAWRVPGITGMLIPLLLFFANCAPPQNLRYARPRHGGEPQRYYSTMGSNVQSYSWELDETYFDVQRDNGAGVRYANSKKAYHPPFIDAGDEISVENINRTKTDMERIRAKPRASKKDENGIRVVKTQQIKKNDCVRKSPTVNDGCNRTYRVKRKDTLYGIAKSFNCQLDELCEINNLTRKSLLKTGMILKVPGNTTARMRREAVNITQAVEENPRFAWPVVPSQAVRYNGSDRAALHGIQITGKSGSPVLCAAPGIVKKVGEMRGYGNYVIVLHEGRYTTVYSGLHNISVSEGEKIATGKIIAYIDPDFKALYFQIGHAGRPVDPLQYLPKKG